MITDSPLLMISYYGYNLSESFKTLVKEVYDQYENINFLIKRSQTIPYESVGILQNETDAGKIQSDIEALLKESNVDYIPIEIKPNKNYAKIIAKTIIKSQEK